MIPSGFEEAAAKYLEENPGLRSKLEEKKRNEPEFAGDHYAQLWFVYTNSPYDEKTYLRYPIARLMKPVDLPLQKLKWLLLYLFFIMRIYEQNIV